MATQKEIALWGAYNLGHVFKQNMQVVKVPDDSIGFALIRHVCVQARGFTMLPKSETIIQDYLKYIQVHLWGCPHCGKLYWYTQLIDTLVGEQAVMLRNYKRMLNEQGYDINMIPPQTYYNIHMVSEDAPQLTNDAFNQESYDEHDETDDYAEPSELDKFNNISW